MGPGVSSRVGFNGKFSGNDSFGDCDWFKLSAHFFELVDDRSDYFSTEVADKVFIRIDGFFPDKFSR